jgi:rieske iron-sulfur protein
VRLLCARASCDASDRSSAGMAVPGRRAVLRGALSVALGVCLLDRLSVYADDPRSARPREGDQFVFAFGEREGQLITPEHLAVGGPQQLAYPIDPVAKVIRNGSFLNQVTLIRLDPAQLTEETRALAAAGVVAYSAVCTHQGCPVSMWHAESKNLFCACHGSQFDPRDRARVIDGPATRRLPMLPLKMMAGVVTAAGGFRGRVGAQPP